MIVGEEDGSGEADLVGEDGELAIGAINRSRL
jgi:hypothetical protein